MRNFWWIAIVVLCGSDPAARGGRGAARSGLVRRLLRSARAVLLHRLRAADARSARASTCTSDAATSSASRSVLADDVLPDYARDLWQRRRTYRTLIDDGRLVLTQNQRFDDFEQRLARSSSSAWYAKSSTLAPARSASATSPARAPEPRPRLPHPHAGRRGGATLGARTCARRTDRRLDAARRLELVNLLLPTRLWVTELEPGVGSDSTRSSHGCRRRRARSRRPSFERRSWRSSRASRTGCYPVRDGALAFDEFTAIYPVGTFNEYTTWNGKPHPVLPDAGTPRAHDPPAHAHRRPHPDRRVVQLLAVAAVHARRHQHAQLLPHAVVADGAGPHRLPAGGVAERGPRQPRRQAVPLSLAALARADVARLHAPERRPHRRAAPDPAGRDRAPLRRRRLLQPVGALRRLRHRRRPHARGDGRPLLHRLLAHDKKPDRLRAPNERRAYYDWL